MGGPVCEAFAWDFRGCERPRVVPMQRGTLRVVRNFVRSQSLCVFVAGVFAACQPAPSAGDSAVAIDGAVTTDVIAVDDAPDAGDGGNEAGLEGGAVDASADTGCPPETRPLVSVSGTVYSNDDGSALANARVSVEGECAPAAITTAIGGQFRLMLPLGSTAFLRAAAPECVPFLRGFEVPPDGTTQDYYVVRRSSFDAMATSLGYTVDPTKGYVWVSFENATVAGYGATISAAHGRAVTRAVGSDTAVAYSETSLAGDLDHWFVLFPNTAVGTTTITLTAPAGHRCTPRQRITEWIVRADAVTYYEADCD